MNDEAIISSIDNLRNIFTIVLALALGEAFQQFVVDTLKKGPGDEDEQPWIRLDGLTAMVAFLLLLIPFFHGTARYFSVEYKTSARPEPYGCYVLLDVVAFICEATGFFVMSRSIRRNQWRRFYGAVIAILLIDSAWDSTVWLTHKHAFEPWLFLNLMFVFVFGAILFAAPSATSRWGPRLALIAMLIRTVADYGTSWELYFPPAATKAVAAAPVVAERLVAGSGGAVSRDSVTATIYFAAPLFTQGEWGWNATLAEALRGQGYRVVLPQEQAAPMVAGTQKFDARQLFRANVAGIESADVVVAVLDGADPDSGTCWEVGYAYRKGRPVIGVRTDLRLGGDDPRSAVNLMLAQSCTELVVVPLAKRTDHGWLGQRIASAIQKIRKEAGATKPK